MKFAVLAGLVGACLLSNGAMAQSMSADDMKWINQCISDNKSEPGGTPPIVRADFQREPHQLGFGLSRRQICNWNG
jgi:hypothetical protein